AGVQPCNKPLDDEPGAEVQPGDLADHLGLQVFFRRTGQGVTSRFDLYFAFAPAQHTTRNSRCRHFLRGPARSGSNPVPVQRPSGVPSLPARRSYLGTSGSRISAIRRRIRVSVVCPSAWAWKLVLIRCRSTGTATLRTSSSETLNRPSMAAIALPPRIRFW